MYSEHTPSEWIEMWKGDIRSMLATMLLNIVSDLLNGHYEPDGSVMSDIVDALSYANKYRHNKAHIEHLQRKSETDAAKWCFKDLKKRGAI